ncbi:MAG TPA: HAMP domain-containing sensor histidine kinase [Polyangiaceae bacterium]|nr:HAMP domain-containing sensor histidine kinase [Polyangiaceae bacterium]
MGSTLYADSRLAAVALRSHELSENAMPSIVELGTMRRELAAAQFALDQAADGEAEQRALLRDHLGALGEARDRYLGLPQFSGEAELWDRARAELANAQGAVDRGEVALDRGAGDEANALVAGALRPAVSRADAVLADLIQLNSGAGQRAALEADQAWARVRKFSWTADVVCAAMTGLLAWLAFQSTRRFMKMQEARVEELEAFASRVAHDIRGPLTPALFAMKMLEREFADDPRPRGIVDRGTRSLNRVSQLVDDLLTFSRSGAAPAGGGHSSLAAVTAGVLQDAGGQGSPSGVQVEVEELPECEVACTPGVLSSILMNLVGNAIKHMPADAPVREVRIQATTEHDRVRVEVADTGAGLPEEMCDRIFEPYVRLDTTRPGLGLGLATVRRLVMAHGGQVGVKSSPGEGALFWFQMPLHRERTP